jgi:Peptidase S24-like
MTSTATAPAPTRHSVQIDLAGEVLRKFGEVRFVARGCSMIPSIYPGDLLTVRSHAIADARQGQIVLCLREGRFWAHRIIRKWRDGNRVVLATRGDALAQEDPSLDENQLLGRVVSIVRYGKAVDLAPTDSLWIKLSRLAVRNSSALAKTLLRRHSLRMRLLGHSIGRSHDSSNDVRGHSNPQILECM